MLELNLKRQTRKRGVWPRGLNSDGSWHCGLTRALQAVGVMEWEEMGLGSRAECSGRLYGNQHF